LKKIISKGYGFEKKRLGELCQKGCHGFKIPLDDSILDISRDIEIWIDNEVSCFPIKEKSCFLDLFLFSLKVLCFAHIAVTNFVEKDRRIENPPVLIIP